ncbi:MAG: FAD-dependent oxidoreductase [Methanoregula sp.]|jgi:heterodisulfide reductase subunit A-like polyferredoxin
MKKSEEQGDSGKVGAVLVVGGGVGGMQAALDLANSGFKVYLTEEGTAIGGRMAQLDKTFPTNDCSMCIISPKLVETGRHLNIELMTDTEVVKVEGKAGDFTVTLRHKPRYIDVAKCTGCTECAQVCPVVIPGRFDEGMARQRAAYKLYPQAVPNAYAIEKKGIAPCRNACPSGQRAQGYIALIRENRYEDALRVIKEDNPFPGICGRICNHRCENACNRALLDQALDIRALKRFVTDKVYSKPRQPVQPIRPTQTKRVAIIGAGPCGLTAAQDLVRFGYPVTVFEALPVAGGMLRVGVPEYRLPNEIIEREVADIVDLGVDLRLNSPVTNLDNLFKQGYAAVLIAVGAHEGIRLPIPGADLDGVLINTVFLRDVRLGRPPELGDRVIVIGSGDVAMDCARTAVRLGKEVHVHYRRSLDEATADPLEIEHAQAEGVTFHYLSNPVEILADGKNRVVGIRLVRMELGEPDESGRRRPMPVAGSEHVIPCDNVIFSVGQRAGLGFIPESVGVGLTREATIAVNPNTFAATRAGVFAAGDVTRGTAFVIEAVDSGHKAAASIHRYLQGEDLEPPLRPELPVIKLTKEEINERAVHGEVHVTPRVRMQARTVEERKCSFNEVNLGFTDEEAQAEAARCLACGVCSECLSCYYICGMKAIDHDMVERLEEVKAGSIILAPGFEVYDAVLSQEYGLGRYPNVLNALQFERILSASGPTMGHIERPSDRKTPKKIAFLQCVGSRDSKHPYCSAVCCMYATKEAIIAKEHEKEIEPTIFFIDMRAYGKGFDAYFERARGEQGVRYVRCMISRVVEDPRTKNLQITYVDESGEMREETFDMVVLSVGMAPSRSARELARKLSIDLNPYGFAKTDPFTPLSTSRSGIYVCGAFQGPKDIPETVAQASGAAGAASAMLSGARGTMVALKEYPEERNVSGEVPRIGVFVCRCGSNIGGVVDVPGLREYAASLPDVVYAEENLYTCSQDTQVKIKKAVEEHRLNRVVVASCSPRTHEPLFQETIREAGLNRYLFEMANIRDQCSWVHMSQKEDATSKARQLLRMAVANARLVRALEKQSKGVVRRALVIGGGLSGMTAATGLASEGFEVFLVEKQGELGGNLRHLYTTVDGKDVRKFLQELRDRVRVEPRIKVFLNADITSFSGYVGNFKTVLTVGSGAVHELEHGVTIVATGGDELKPREYLYGEDRRVLTQLDLEKGLATGGINPSELREVVMVQCVGSRDEERPYCSRVCCAEAVKNALSIKALSPKTRVIILYRDMRMYGFLEEHYARARRAGIRFVRYEEKRKPQVSAADGALELTAYNPVLRESVSFHPDLLVLSTATVPADTAQLAATLKVPRTTDGFFLEAHMKLRPVDFASEGIYLCGIAHSPKLIDESLSQASAAVSRACTILSRETIQVGGVVSVVDQEKCAACLSCVRVCPYNVPTINVEGAAEIEVAKCQGCGLCASECPAKAISLQHFTDEQIIAKCEAISEGRY